MRHPGRLALGWALGVIMTIALVAASGGWFEYRWYPRDDCERSKAGAINVGSFEVVTGQTDPCYLRRPRIRPWQWADGIADGIGVVRSR